MNYEVIATPVLPRIKKLAKKYSSLKAEYTELVGTLSADPNQGTPLGNDCYKIRLVIASKDKGKSGGARVISCIKIVESKVYLLTIYDKSEKDSISDKALNELLTQID